MNKEALVRSVAGELGYPRETVAKLLQTFLATIAEALLDGDTVFLMHFGKFYTKKLGRRSGKLRYGIFFKAQPAITRRMRECGRKGNRYYQMLSKNQLALARLTGRCPRCDKGLATPTRCSACGTLPLKE